MTAHEIAVTILTLLNVITVIINIVFMLKMDKRDTDKLLDDLEKNKLIYPVATIKAEWSEEDMKKLRELIKDAKPVKITPAEDDSKKCTCDHFYDSVYIEQDIKHCCERMIFHCERCNHEEIIPIKRGLLTNTLIRGGF